MPLVPAAGMDKLYSEMATADALWDTDEHLDKFREALMEPEKKWYEGSYVEGDKFIRTGS